MPEPQAAPVQVSILQLDILEQMVRRTTSAQRLVKRAQIILEAFKGTSNTKISQHQHMDYETVRRWRDRWRAAESRLQAIEATGEPKLLRQAIEVLLTDAPRPGAPGTFTLEQFMRIIALACEKPEAADRPVSSWTPRELADEAVKRGIVEQISPRTVERFLKGERFTAASQAVLADSTPRRPRSTGRRDLHRV
jgi:putative transposase